MTHEADEATHQVPRVRPYRPQARALRAMRMRVMSQSRIWNVIEEPANDEGNDFTRISFDNEQAAKDFIEAVHKLEYEGYIQERPNWGKEARGWTLDPGGKFMTRVIDGRTLKSYLPPEPVSYELWLAGKTTGVPDGHGGKMPHAFDQMHEASKMRVEPDWLFGHVPSLVRDSGTVRTVDEAKELDALFTELARTQKKGDRVVIIRKETHA